MKKKALVLGTDGEIEQLQAGDYVFDESYIVQTNGEAGSIVAGAPVYTSGVDTVKKANAAATATSKVLGLVADPTISTGVAGNIQEGGILTLTTAAWDAVAGTTGGLTQGVKYYLGAAGLLTATVPTSGINAPIGSALSTTELLIHIERIVRL